MEIKFLALSWVCILTVLLNIICTNAADLKLIQTLEDEIGSENFTYYRLQRTGVLQLELVSIYGDVDVYISSEIQHPDYSNYDLKSETCGIDVVVIPVTMSRPVYISLFGHPNYLASKYRVTIYEVDEPIIDDYEALVDKYERYYYEEMEGGSVKKDKDAAHPTKSTRDTSGSDQHVEDELPLWWKILLGILEFSIEVIL